MEIHHKSNLKYKSVIFNRNGSSRLIASADLVPGWNQVQELPKSADISSISLMNPDLNLIIKKKLFRDYEDTMTPSMPTEVTVSHGDQSMSGLLVKKDQQSISLLTENEGLLEITQPYILKYTTCHQGQCEPIKPRVNLFLESLLETNEPISRDLTFTAQGFSWEASYKLIIDFSKEIITRLISEIQISNQTNLNLENVNVSFLAKAEDRRIRPRALEVTMAQPISSEQTQIGSVLYSLEDPVTVYERSLASFTMFSISDLPMKEVISLDILARAKHPLTKIHFEVPEELENGMPDGKVECWSDIWLADDHIPMAGPGEEIKLNLGENAFIDCDIEIETTEVKETKTENKEQEEIERTQFKINVSIKNRSNRKISNMVAFQRINREPKLFQFLTESQPIHAKWEKNRLLFTIPELEKDDEFSFMYSVIA
jgi:hypothetical protein